MNFLIYLIVTTVALLIVVYIIVLMAKHKLNQAIGKDNLNEIVKTIKNTKALEMEEYTRPKSVSGMTKLLEPSIIRDFPDFNKEILFKKIEKNLNTIFEAIEEKNIARINGDDELVLIKDSLKNTIEDLKERKISISYLAVKFHAHAIKNYEKRDGVATITTSSTVEYFYTNNEISSAYQDVKKQTRYTCKFVYVFDESKIRSDVSAITIHCPNCGAPLKGLGNVKCSYCGSDVKPINLKAWKMVKYEEDYGN